MIACGYLLVSGVHILLDFPELYWGHTGYRGYPAIFKLSDWGLSWEAAGKLGDRRWGRNYHFTFAWVFLINGVVYVAWNLYRKHFRNHMSPRAASGRERTSVPKSAIISVGARATRRRAAPTARCRRRRICYRSSCTSRS